MPDQRRHRGPHQEDSRLFAPEHWSDLSAAAGDLSWLMTRDYAPTSASKIVGDRYSLDARQRVAVSRSACSDQAMRRRRRHQVETTDLDGNELWIDGYNVLTSLEAAISGGVILHARDGTYRDMASMHGTYRRVHETLPAMRVLGELTAQWNVAICHWLLDAPVSNSGRLSNVLREVAADNGWNWHVELVPDPDFILVDCAQIVATADSQILDQAERWLNLARTVIDLRIPDSWIVDLS